MRNAPLGDLPQRKRRQVLDKQRRPPQRPELGAVDPLGSRELAGLVHETSEDGVDDIELLIGHRLTLRD